MVSLAEIGSSFAVTDNDIFNACFFEHIGGNFTCICARRFEMDIFRADFNVGAFCGLNSGGNVNKGNAKYDITFCVCNQRFHFFDKRLCFGRGFVHFPVTCDNCFTKFFFHEILLLFTSLQVSTKYPPVTVIFLIYRSMPQYRAVLYLQDIQGKRRRLWRYGTSYRQNRVSESPQQSRRRR